MLRSSVRHRILDRSRRPRPSAVATEKEDDTDERVSCRREVVVLRLEQVTLAVGGKDLLFDASVHIHPGEKIGLVGRNGSGKTTLLRAIVGELSLENGSLTVRRGARVGYLPQTAVSGSTQTLWEEARSGMTRLNELSARLEATRAAVERGESEAIERLGEMEEAFRLAGGYALDERVGGVLHGLGFRASDWQRPCDTFSGGWQMRIALARTLLSEPDLLLLDEPTNHLDLHARSWLAQFLDRSPHTVVIVSHDRWLLDRAVRKIVEVRNRTLYSFSGNLSAWLNERTQRFEQAQVAYAQQQEEIAKLERFVERFKAKATKASQARSRQKQLDKMERIEAPERERRPRLRLPEAPHSGHEAIILRQARMGWPDGPDVLDDVELVIERGHKVAILGPNGAGKSTLLAAIRGEIALRSGQRKLGHAVRLGVFSQDLAQALPSDDTPLEVVMAAAPTLIESKARAVLGALGLEGTMANRPIAGLSGGEKARVALALFAVRPYNVLLLDEPTNHLDATTVDVLIDALRPFEGALILVTHDRYLVEALATHIVLVGNGRAEVHAGVRSELLEPSAAPVGAGEQPSAAPSMGAQSYAERKRLARERERAQRRIRAISEEVEATETRMAAIDEELFVVAADYERCAELARERSEAEARVEALFEEWEQLEALVED